MNFEAWVYAVFSAAVIGLAYDHFRLRQSQADDRLALEKLRTFVAEHYVRSPELEKVVTEMGRMQASLDEVVKLLYEMKGSSKHSGV